MKKINFSSDWKILKENRGNERLFKNISKRIISLIYFKKGKISKWENSKELIQK